MQVGKSEFLSRVPIFKGLSQQQLDEIALRMEVRHYSRNDHIVRQGNPAESIFIVQSGMLAVTRTSLVTGEVHTLAHLKEGDLLGEIELLSGPSRLTTATATALTQAVLLEMQGTAFLDLLQREKGAALELARVLAQRLRATTERIGTDDGMANRVCVLVGNGRGVGVTTLGVALSLSLASSTQSATVYTEYPDASRLGDLFSLAPGSTPHTHPAGFDVAVPAAQEQGLSGLQSSMFLDELTLSYPNIIVGLSGELDDSLDYLLERTDQVVIVTSPAPADAETLAVLTARLRQLLQADRTSLYIVSNSPRLEYDTFSIPPYVDFNVPYLAGLLHPRHFTGDNLPDTLSTTVATLADRLKRTNQLRVYIPTTVDVDRQLDTSAYVTQALELLGNLFGGATSDSAQGVWKSEHEGLVGETVYIVTSYVTQTDLDRHLERILDFVDRLKHELKQEAMALEVNERLMLI